MGAPVGLVQRHCSSGPDESDHLGNESFRLRDVHEHEACGCEIERLVGEGGALRVPAQHLGVGDPAFVEERSSQLDRLVADLDADHGSFDADSLGKELEAALRAAADLDHAGPGSNPDPIEEPRGFFRELFGLLPKALLLG